MVRAALAWRSEALSARMLGDAGRPTDRRAAFGGIVGGYDPHLRRLILMLHVQGQMTCERIVALARYNAARSFGHWRFTMARNVG